MLRVRRLAQRHRLPKNPPRAWSNIGEHLTVQYEKAESSDGDHLRLCRHLVDGSMPSTLGQETGKQASSGLFEVYQVLVRMVAVWLDLLVHQVHIFLRHLIPQVMFRKFFKPNGPCGII